MVRACFSLALFLFVFSVQASTESEDEALACADKLVFSQMKGDWWKTESDLRRLVEGDMGDKTSNGRVVALVGESQTGKTRFASLFAYFLAKKGDGFVYVGNPVDADLQQYQRKAPTTTHTGAYTNHDELPEHFDVNDTTIFDYPITRNFRRDGELNTDLMQYWLVLGERVSTTGTGQVVVILQPWQLELIQRDHQAFAERLYVIRVPSPQPSDSE